MEQLLSYLAVAVAEEFNIDIMDGIEAVCLSPFINDIIEKDVCIDTLTTDDIKNTLFKEIRNGE